MVVMGLFDGFRVALPILRSSCLDVCKTKFRGFIVCLVRIGFFVKLGLFS